jgi:hypothetical protein
MASDDALPFPHPRNCPSRAKVLLHKDAIKSLEQDIIDIENEINRLEQDVVNTGEIARLQTRLQDLRQRKTNHASYISPLRRLPPEILGEIVYMGLYNGVKLSTLTQICGTLREVVLGMSALWNRITLFTVRVVSTLRYTYPWVSRFLLNKFLDAQKF